MPSTESHAGLAAAARLRRVAAALACGSHPPADDAQWLAGRLDAYLAAESELGLDCLLGLIPPPGGLSWRSAGRLAERDAAIRELARKIAGRPNAQAHELRSRLDRYAASSWSRDRVSKTPTATNELLYRIFTLDPNPPRGIRQLTTIITA